jgi:aspartate kinase
VDRPCVVQKYGGSSVADVAQIRAVAERVVATRRSGVDVVVVVSAMGNTTNELLALAAEVSSDPGRRELDLLISVGERVAMTLLAMAIQDLGEPAQSFTGSQSGIMTDDQHAAAAVIAVRPHRIRRALDEGQIAIVAGFQGVSLSGEVTTLGRGGSDTTAVVLTAALGAEYCEICSDVDGIYTADPRSVPAAKRIDTLSMDTAIAMAQAGTRVLGAEALAAAAASGITLVAGGTNKPSGSGTRVGPETPSRGVIAIARNEDLFLAEPGATLDGVSGAIHARLPDGRCLIDARNLGAPDTWGLGVTCRPVATVSALGEDICSRPALTDRAAEVVEHHAPGARWWALGDRFCAVVDRSLAQAIEAALHAALIPD